MEVRPVLVVEDDSDSRGLTADVLSSEATCLTAMFGVGTRTLPAIVAGSPSLTTA